MESLSLLATLGEGKSLLYYIQKAEEVAVQIIVFVFYKIDFSFLDYGIAGIKVIHVIGLYLAYHMVKQIIKFLPHIPTIIMSTIVKTISAHIAEGIVWGVKRIFFLIKKCVLYLFQRCLRVFSYDTFQGIRYFFIRLWYWRVNSNA